VVLRKHTVAVAPIFFTYFIEFPTERSFKTKRSHLYVVENNKIVREAHPYSKKDVDDYLQDHRVTPNRQQEVL